MICQCCAFAPSTRRLQEAYLWLRTCRVHQVLAGHLNGLVGSGKLGRIHQPLLACVAVGIRDANQVGGLLVIKAGLLKCHHEDGRPKQQQVWLGWLMRTGPKTHTSPMFHYSIYTCPARHVLPLHSSNMEILTYYRLFTLPPVTFQQIVHRLWTSMIVWCFVSLYLWPVSQSWTSATKHFNAHCTEYNCVCDKWLDISSCH